MVLDLDALPGKAYNVDEVAEMLGVKADAIRRKIREGLLPARRIPGTKGYMVLGDDLHGYIMGGETVKATTPKTTSTPKQTTAKADPQDRSLFDEGAPPPEKPRTTGKTDKARRIRPAVGFGERISAFLDHVAKTTGKPQSAIARDAGMHPSMLSKMRSGNRTGSSETHRALSELFGLNVEWLLTGRGEMLK